MSVAPEDLAAARFKPVRQALERIAKAEAARVESAGRLEQLRAAVGPAEHRDREALGQALFDGKAEPPSQAAEIQTELDHEERRGEALRLAVGAARQRIGELVAEHRASWRRQTMRELAKAKRRYENAISELDAARDSLSDEASLVSWLDSGSSAAAASDPARWSYRPRRNRSPRRQLCSHARGAKAGRRALGRASGQPRRSNRRAT